MQQQRGVNLGGWLVLERWMVPSVFEGTGAKDEWGLAHELNADEFRVRMERHRDTFITESDISRIAKIGLEFVRVPIGYWLFEGQDGFISGPGYIDRLFEWCTQYSIGVILDFHAPKGSQNGWDHSGKAGEVAWVSHPDQAKADALKFIAKLVDEYGQQPQLIAVELLNEPIWEVSLNTLIDYYRSANEIVRSACREHVAVIVSDAFRPEEMSKRLRRARLNDVVLDVHLYQLYTPEDRRLSIDGHIHKAEKEWGQLLEKLSRYHHVLVGEWSAAMSELYLQLQESQKHYTVDDYKRYFMSQRLTFERTGVSWSYWTAKTEDKGIWSLLDQHNLELL